MNDNDKREAATAKARDAIIDAGLTLDRNSFDVMNIAVTAGYQAASEHAANGWNWIPVSEMLPEPYTEVEITELDTHDAYDPTAVDRWIERGVTFCGDHWLVKDNGHNRINVRLELEVVVAWRPVSQPYRGGREDDR